MSAVSRRRLEELMASRATQGLEDDERRELDSLLQTYPQGDDEGFDLAAAALDLALQGSLSELPPDLNQRLQNQGRRWLPPADSH